MLILRPAEEGAKVSISEALRQNSVYTLGLHADEGVKVSVSKVLRWKSANTLGQQMKV